MSLTSINLYSTAAGTYGIVNACIGQLKDAILAACSVATVISDNNPAATVQRSVVIKVGNSEHYLKLYAQSGSYMYVIALYVDHNSQADLLGNINVPNHLVKILASANCLSIHFYTAGTDIGSNSFCFLKLTNGTWIGGGRPGNGYQFYHNSLDVTMIPSGAGSSGRDASGNLAIAPVMVSYGGVWLGTCACYYAYYDPTMAASAYYNDGTYNYLAYGGKLLRDS